MEVHPPSIAQFKNQDRFIFLFCRSLLSSGTVLDVRGRKRALVVILERKGKQLFSLQAKVVRIAYQ